MLRSRMIKLMYSIRCIASRFWCLLCVQSSDGANNMNLMLHRPCNIVALCHILLSLCWYVQIRFYLFTYFYKIGIHEHCDSYVPSGKTCSFCDSTRLKYFDEYASSSDLLEDRRKDDALDEKFFGKRAIRVRGEDKYYQGKGVKNTAIAKTNSDEAETFIAGRLKLLEALQASNTAHLHDWFPAHKSLLASFSSVCDRNKLPQCLHTWHVGFPEW